MIYFVHDVIGDREIVARFIGAEGASSLEIRDFLDDVATRILNAARATAPRRTGNLAERGLQRERALPRGLGLYEARVGLKTRPVHDVFVRMGTGIFGPRKSPITAAHGNVLVFAIDGKTFFRRSVKGQKPNLFFERAYVSVRDTYIPGRLAGLAIDMMD